MIRKFGTVGGIANQPPGLNVGMGAGNAQPGDVLAPMTATNDNGEFTGTLALTGDAAAANVLAGKTFYKDDAKTKLPGSMVNRAGAEVNARASNVATAGKLGFYPQSDGFFDTNSIVSYSDPSFIAANIAAGMSMFGLTGTGAKVKRFKEGETTAVINSSYHKITVTNLGFSPIVIVAQYNSQVAFIFCRGATWNSEWRNYFNMTTSSSMYIAQTANQGTAYDQFRVLPDEFEMLVEYNYFGSGSGTGYSCQWRVFG